MKTKKYKTEKDIVYNEIDLQNEIKEYTYKAKSKLVEREKDNPPKKNDEKLEPYYNLNKDAVDKLVNAEQYVSRGEITPGAEKYNKNKKKVPVWLKSIFIKFWFSGAVCFFFVWGLGLLLFDLFDMAIVTGAALGLVIDLLINNVLRFVSTENEYDAWMLLPIKKFWTLFIHVLYGVGVMLLIIFIYDGINSLLIAWQNLPADSVPLGVEPLFFGVAFTICDLFFVGIKDLIVFIVKKSKNKKVENGVE